MATTGGLSTARLRRGHDVMAAHVDSGAVPGLVGLVARRGAVHVEADGRLGLDGPPVRRDSIFRVASITKPVTAVAALVLVEECGLRLDDPVDAFLPELADRRVLARLDGPLDDTVAAQRPITPRDLLTFTSGHGVVMAPPGTYPIQQAYDDAHMPAGPPQPATVPPPDEWIAGVGRLPLLHQPGERWMYDWGSEILGVLVARAAGQPFDTFVRERVLEPIGMRDTGFSVPADDIARLVTAYAPDPATGALRVYDEAAGGQWSRPPALASGRGGLVSTVDDYLAFGRMLLDRGRAGGARSGRVLARTTVEAMTSDQLTSEQKAFGGLYDGQFDDHGWGFGGGVVTRRTRPEEPVGAFAWTGGLGTLFQVDPAEDMVTILFTQRAWNSPVWPAVHRDFLTLAYAAIDD